MVYFESHYAHIPYKCNQAVIKQDLCECLHVDDIDQSEKEGQPVLHSGHVRQQAALRKNLHHCGEKNTENFV